MTQRQPLLAGAAALFLLLSAHAPTPVHAPPPEPGEEIRELEGWTVHVDSRLIDDDDGLGERALALLRNKLYDVTRVLTPTAVEKLREVPIWVGVEDEHGRHPCACYHPSKRWLEQHGYDPRKAKSVDIANAANFMTWTLDQPSMVLHELAHAYHHRVLGHDHAKLLATYEAAVQGGAYLSVLRYNGKRERHYALENVQEYFAEATEAYFGTNDFYPFVRAELALHDRAAFELMEELWNPDAGK